MKIEINELKSIQDVIKYLNDYAESFDIQDSDIIKCISVLQEYADQQKFTASDEEIIKVSEKYANDNGGGMWGIAYKAHRKGMEKMRNTYQPKQIDWDEISREFFQFQMSNYQGTSSILKWFKSKLT